MAKKYEPKNSPAVEKFNASARADKSSIKNAAESYAYKGLKGLGLNLYEQQTLAKKIIPIVKMQMTSDRNRAASRAKAQVKREKISDKKAAIKKSFGGSK
jgi:hypothetical protein